jgi:glycosyltransferase involved in cell wall biosynthesis
MYALSKKVSVIIPAKDEAGSIGDLIARTKATLDEYRVEIIVVDDGSEDSTRDIAQKSGAETISHTSSMGKGAAMRDGAIVATGDILVFLDGDGAHYPEDIPNLIASIFQNKAGLVVGSRDFRGSKTVGFYLPRRITNKLASFVTSVIISFLLPLATWFRCPIKWIGIEDAECGFKAISKDNWHGLNLVSHGFEIESEIIYESAKNRLIIQNAPISCDWSYKISRLSIIRDGFRTLKLLLGKLITDIGRRRDNRLKPRG